MTMENPWKSSFLRGKSTIVGICWDIDMIDMINYNWLVVTGTWMDHDFAWREWNVIIPTDELTPSSFRGVGQPLSQSHRIWGFLVNFPWTNPLMVCVPSNMYVGFLWVSPSLNQSNELWMIASGNLTLCELEDSHVQWDWFGWFGIIMGYIMG